MFVDASAIVAILTREPEADAFADLLEAAQSPITSPIAIFEAALGLARKRHASVAEAEADVREFLSVARVACVPITEAEAETALGAYSRYGKGRGHPAQLNLGDCLAYAAARTNRVSLLFKGDDFSKTDIAPATRGGEGPPPISPRPQRRR
jgi:ribonuclease VapC